MQQQATPPFPSLHGLASITAVTARHRGDLLIRHPIDDTRDDVMEMWSERAGVFFLLFFLVFV